MTVTSQDALPLVQLPDEEVSDLPEPDLFVDPTPQVELLVDQTPAVDLDRRGRARASAAQVLRTAAADIGYVETPNNITPYWTRQEPRLQGNPWCAAFVLDVLHRCGNTLLRAVPQPFYTPSMESWAKKVRRWVSVDRAKPGDVVIFGMGKSYAVHTGFLERRYDAQHVVVIEGNTSAGNAGSQNNGGGVYRRVRHRRLIRGCISLADQWGGSTTPTGGATTPTGGAANSTSSTTTTPSMTTTRWPRLTKDQARAIQRWLMTSPRLRRMYGPADTFVDGAFGPITTKALQTLVGTAADGAFGPRSVAPLESTLALSPSRAAGWYPALTAALVARATRV